MTKICYKPWNPKPESIAMVETAEDIINEYEADGYTLTLRQLYYQFVSRDLIENTERSYKNLGNLISKARMAGMISWEAIEDRNREHHEYWTEENPVSLIRKLPHWIRFDRWANQDYYLEVWVEKEALGNVVERACDKWHIPHMACKGYLSASEAWRAGERFADKFAEGKQCVLLHLGDHDPSGIDMTRDNQDRLDLFTGYHQELDFVDVQRIALNMDQVEEYRPPRNPAKITDSRAKEYIAQHGTSSWELDALEPSVISNLIYSNAREYIDLDKWAEVEHDEQSVINQFTKLRDNWYQVSEYLDELD